MTDALRDVPHDNDVEQCLLASAMFVEGSYEQIMQASPEISEKSFFSEKNRIIWNAITEIAADGGDLSVLSVSRRLEDTGKLEKVGGRDFLLRLISLDFIPPAKQVKWYAHMLCDIELRRNVVKIAERHIDNAYQPGDWSGEDILNAAQDDLYKLSSTQTGTDTLTDAFISTKDVLEEIRDEAATGHALKGASTGYPELDRLTSGLRPGTMNIIAARPSVGKTAFAMNLIENIATCPDTVYPAVVFSLEMPTGSLIRRMLSAFARCPLSKLEANDITVSQYDRLLGHVGLLMRKPEGRKGYGKLQISDASSLTPMRMRTVLRRACEAYGGISAVMVDYVQLMEPDRRNDNRAIELGGISRSLKLMSKDFNVPILALAQLNRQVEARKSHVPVNSDLRESGSLEQDADTIMFLQRPSLYAAADGQSPSPEAQSSRLDDAYLYLTKNRFGSIGKVDLSFAGDISTFFSKGQEPFAGSAEEEQEYA